MNNTATAIARAFTTPHSPNDFISVFTRRRPAVKQTSAAAATLHTTELTDTPADTAVGCESDQQAGPRCVRFANDTDSVAVAAGQTVLDALEAAGHQPKTGCRRGICRTCVSPLHSGVVANVDSGELTEAGTHFRICVSEPLTDIDTTIAMKGSRS